MTGLELWVALVLVLRLMCAWARGWGGGGFFLVIPGYLELMLGDVIRKLMWCARCLYTFLERVSLANTEELE